MIFNVTQDLRSAELTILLSLIVDEIRLISSNPVDDYQNNIFAMVPIPHRLALQGTDYQMRLAGRSTILPEIGTQRLPDFQSLGSGWEYICIGVSPGSHMECGNNVSCFSHNRCKLPFHWSIPSYSNQSKSAGTAEARPLPEAYIPR